MYRKLLIILIFVNIIKLSAQTKFSAHFESGSLGTSVVAKDKPTAADEHYIVHTHIDPPSPEDKSAHRSRRWFYFKIEGVKNKTIALDIIANDSRRPMYSYDNVNFIRFTPEECPKLNKTITKRYDNDSVFIAYFTPYTNSRSTQKINEWSKSPHVHKFNIGKSSENRDMHALVLSQNMHSGLIPNKKGKLRFTKADKAKKIIYIHGRAHPSESPSSWHLEAMIDNIISDYTDILEHCIIYIIPITNPDGVIEGLSRTNTKGVNIEVNYDSNVKQTSSEVLNIKRLLLSIKQAGGDLHLALNMHSQSTPKASYWVHSAESTSKEYNRRQLLLASLTAQQNPYFKWSDLDYSTLKSLFIEGWLFDKFDGRCTSITFETPYSYYGRYSRGEWVTLDNLKRLAQHNTHALIDALEINNSKRVTLSEPEKARGFKQSSESSKVYFSQSYLRSKRWGAGCTYSGKLTQGDYLVYRWNVAGYGNGSQAGWSYHGTHSQRKSGKLKYTISADREGEIFDQILFIRR